MDTGTYRLVYLAFGFEGIDSPEMRQEVMERSLSWLREAAITCNGLIATIVGPAGPDVLWGTSGDDVIHGLGGNDVIHRLEGDDTICGGPGQDVLHGGRATTGFPAATAPTTSTAALDMTTLWAMGAAI